MKTEPSDTGIDTVTDSNLSPETIFDAFADNTRRETLQYLSTRIGAISIDELAEILTASGLEPTHEHARIALHHKQLPKLADVGLVRYDTDEKRVELAVDCEQIAPYLDLSSPDSST